MPAAMKKTALSQKRTPVLVTMQQKGGVGKTAITKILGVYFAMTRKIRVLLMDFDPQCNLSNKFVEMEKKQGIEGYYPPIHPDYNADTDYDWDGHSSCALLFGSAQLVPYPTHYELLDIVPGEGERLSAAEQNLPNEIKQKVINRPREWLTLDEVQNAYDLVIIDTPPSRQALTRGALRAATHILLPMEPEPNSEEGLSDMLEMWRNENLHRTDDDMLEMLGILPNKVKRYGNHDLSLHSAIMERLREDPATGVYMLPFSMHNKTAITESDFPGEAHSTILDLPKEHKDRREAEVLCRHIEGKIFGDVTG